MRAQFLPTLILGLLLVYLATFGLAGLGVQFSLSSINFNARQEFPSGSLGGAWAPTYTGSGLAPSIASQGPSDGSSLLLDASAGTAAGTATSELTFSCTQFEQSVNVPTTIFFSALITTGSVGSFIFGYYGLHYRWAVQVTNTQIKTDDGKAFSFTGAGDGKWHLYRVQNSVTNYIDAITLAVGASNTDLQVLGTFYSLTNGGNNYLDMLAQDGAKVYMDWLELDSGTQATPATQQTTTGSLLAICTRNGVNLGTASGVDTGTATVTIAGLSGVTNSSGEVLITNIPAGAYTAVASYSGFSDVPEPVTIQAGKVATQTFPFATGGVDIRITTQVVGGHGSISPSGVVDIGYAGGHNSKIFTITADSGYYIASLVLINPSTTLSTPISFPAQATSTTVTINDDDTQISETLSATFATANIELTVYSAHGSPTPAVGTHQEVSGTSQQCSVTSPVTENGVSYTCTGWAGTGSVPASGTTTSVNVLIMQTSTITWTWKTTNNPALGPWTLTVSSSYGSPNPSGATSHADTSSVTCSVTSPDGSYTCTGWTGTGSVPSSGTGTSTTFYITQDSTITWNWQYSGSNGNGNNGSGSNNSSVPSFNFNIDWGAIGKNIQTLIEANSHAILMIGALMALVSFIGFIMPPKRIPISF